MGYCPVFFSRIQSKASSYKMGDKDQEEFSEHYEFILTPKNASNEAKTGVTFRGSSPEYKEAHQTIIGLLKIR